MTRSSQLSFLICSCLTGAVLAQHDGDIGLIIDAQKLSSVVTVSYTHLTLPTILRV